MVSPRDVSIASEWCAKNRATNCRGEGRCRRLRDRGVENEWAGELGCRNAVRPMQKRPLPGCPAHGTGPQFLYRPSNMVEHDMMSLMRFS